jgi:sulfide:quinone oxidoreductase
MPMSVVIAGGGIAARETVRALHDLAGDRVRITLVAPEPWLGLGVDIRRDRLAGVDPRVHVVTLAGGGTVPYDALVLAVGARPRPAFPHVVTLGTASRCDELSSLLVDLAARFPRSVAFVVPAGATWPLPIYALALMTARQLRSMGIYDARIDLVSPEAAPLGLLGDEARHAVEHLLEEFGVTFHPLVDACVTEPGRVELGGGRKLLVDRVVALPLLDGPAPAGLPSDDRGFLRTDGHGRVSGVADVYAAGDATDFPVKQDGLARQQAMAVAQHLAARVGAVLEAEPFRPVLRGKLLTDVGPTYLSDAFQDGGLLSGSELWCPAAEHSDAPHVDVEVRLGAALDEALGVTRTLIPA